ncbi:MAG: hypothetical protein WKG00_03290 [Polyangiaceae bacterium]
MEMKFVAIYVGPKKLAEIEETKFSFMSNGEQLVSIDEVVESTGVLTAEGTFDTLLPFGGASVDAIDLVLGQKIVELLLGPFNGKAYKVGLAKVTKVDGTSTARSGVSKATYTWRGSNISAV